LLVKNLPKISGFFLLQLLILSQTLNLYAQQNKVIIGYVGGYRGLVNTDRIVANELTHINYAFVDIKNNRAWLHREATDTVNFRHLNLLKQQNAALKILISIGGWTWSKNFSDAVLTDTSRQRFAASAIDIIKKYEMDGIDIDWEYPSRAGYEGNIYRPEDKQNYTLMFKELRKQLDSLQLKNGRKYLLTTATGAFKSFLDGTEMEKVQQYLDYVNLMTYDFSGGKIASHHTPLYASTTYKAQNNSNNAVQLFIAAGVPKDKLVLGVAFYGRVASLAPGAKGLGDSVVTYSRGIGFTAIKDSVLKQPGNKAYRDRHAKAPYMYNKKTRQFITYDNLWSVKKKCKYVKKQNLAGVMFWEYDSDSKGYLLGKINDVLK
jgi:chitinase